MKMTIDEKISFAKQMGEFRQGLVLGYWEITLGALVVIPLVFGIPYLARNFLQKHSNSIEYRVVLPAECKEPLFKEERAERRNSSFLYCRGDNGKYVALEKIWPVRVLVDGNPMFQEYKLVRTLEPYQSAPDEQKLNGGK